MIFTKKLLKKACNFRLFMVSFTAMIFSFMLLYVAETPGSVDSAP